MTAKARTAWDAWVNLIGDLRRARLYAAGLGVALLFAVAFPSVWTFLLLLWMGGAVVIFQVTDLFKSDAHDEEADEWF